MLIRLITFVLLCATLACDNVPGQYRHDKGHHDNPEQRA